MSDSESELSPYVSYRERPEWQDIVPFEQEEGVAPVVQIAYSDRFRETFSYFRSVFAKDELSERALEITRDAAMLNPANYSVWVYRRKLLKALNKDLIDEQNFLADIIEKHPKNYQVWQHRKEIVEWTQDPSMELEFTESMFSDDAKNYHCWQHRQWIISRFGLWDGELGFTAKLIEKDRRNNSAWNQRYFVVSHEIEQLQANVGDDGNDAQKAIILHREIEFTKKQIARDSHNESPWSYIKGVFRLMRQKLHLNAAMMALCDELMKDKSPHVAAFLIDAKEELLGEQGETAPSSDQVNSILEEVVHLCEVLADEWDTIRKRYWNYLAELLQVKYQGLPD